MPAKDWDLQADFATWTLTDLDETIVAGQLRIAAGHNSGTGVSPAYQCANWERYANVQVWGSLPRGTNVFLRFRSGATQVACEGAGWSNYVNGFDDAGYMRFDLRVEILNEAIAVGEWVQFELTLLGE